MIKFQSDIRVTCEILNRLIRKAGILIEMLGKEIGVQTFILK